LTKQITSSSDDQNPSHPVSSLSTSAENVHNHPLGTQELAVTIEASDNYKTLDRKNYDEDLLMEQSNVRVHVQRCVGLVADLPSNLKLEKLLNTLRTTADKNKVLIRKTMKKCFKGKQICPRSSKYRGVSKNGSLWQVRDFSNKQKFHKG